MGDATPTRHPDADDLQRWVDGPPDAARDGAIAAHVASCAACRDTISRLRSVDAALALASPPPADLLDRIRARRLERAHVILPAVPGADEEGDAAPWPGHGHPS